jgi:hypothetical protein
VRIVWLDSVDLCLVQVTKNESFLFPNVSHQPVSLDLHTLTPHTHSSHFLFVPRRYIEWYCINSIHGSNKLKIFDLYFEFVLKKWKISGFRYDVDENCVHLDYCAVSRGNYLQTFRDNISIPLKGPIKAKILEGFTEWSYRNFCKKLPLKIKGPSIMRQTGCPETSVMKYNWLSKIPFKITEIVCLGTSIRKWHCSLYNNAEEPSSLFYNICSE